MKVEKHLSNDLKPLTTGELISDILDAMEELKFSHLPVIDEDRLYLGLVCEDDLLEAEESDPLSRHLRLLKPYSIFADADIFEAIKVLGEGNLSLLPVVSPEKHYKGYISALELIQDIGRGLTFTEPGGILVLSVAVRDYQLTQIAQIVESEDAKIIGLHLASDLEDDKLLICMKVNQTDLGRIVKSFERYNYNVIQVFHKSLFDDSLEDRYQSFMKYLNP